MDIDKLKPLVVFVVVLCFLPPILGFNNYYVLIVTYILFYAVVVSAWNIIGGFAGQLDLGAGAYVGLGCYAMGTLLIKWNVTPWIGIIASGIVSVFFAAVIGYAAFRFGLKEVWYALATIASVVVLQKFFLVWEEVGGPAERYLPVKYGSIYYLRFATYTPYYYILLALLAISIFINIWVRESKLGFDLLAVRENEEAAEMLGVDARMSKLKALMIYSFLTGVAGALYALIAGYIHPSQFDNSISLEVAVLGIVGGLGSIYSPPASVFILHTLSEYLRSTIGAWIPGVHLIFYGVVLMVTLIFIPEGLSSLFKKLSLKYKPSKREIG